MNKKLVPIESFEEEIIRLKKEEGGASITTAVVRSDVNVPSGVEKDVINRILKLGLNCGLAGRPIGKD